MKFLIIPLENLKRYDRDTGRLSISIHNLTILDLDSLTDSNSEDVIEALIEENNE
jgi:hypothetical protein